MKTWEEIRGIIEEEDVEFIRLQFTDVFGKLKNVAVTPRQLSIVIESSHRIEGRTMFGDAEVYDGDLYLKPDLETFVILPWRPQHGKVAKLICDVCYEDGRPFEMCPRYILKKTIEQITAKGYRAIIDPECEFFLFHTDDNGNPTTVTHEQAGYMDVGPMDFGENARRDIALTLEEMGFDVRSSLHEMAPGQHEIDFSGDEGLKIADALVTFKFAVRSIAKRFGLHATFMPKPVQNQAGSGMHLNVSMYKDGQPLFVENGDEVTNETKWFMGGVLKHMESMCAITNPTVNSYKRLLSGFDAPDKIAWSTKGHDCIVKLHTYKDTAKVELCFPDSSANPYLALAVCLAAGVEGIENKVDPGANDARVTGNQYKCVPNSLMAAIGNMKTDSLVEDILGSDLVNLYSELKMNEWNDYMRQVTDWEINRYLAKM